MKAKKGITITIIILVLVTSIFLISSNEENQKSTSKTKTSSETKQEKTKPSKVPLTNSEKEKIEDALLSSQFIKDIPTKNPISIRFFYFENGSRIWQDRFYMADGELIDKTSTGIEIIIHSKYIEDLGTKELCSVIQDARNKGDLGTETEYSQTKLAWKYKGMLKHKACFGL